MLDSRVALYTKLQGVRCLKHVGRGGWAVRSQLEPIKRAARTLKKYWDQIENYFRHRITNAGAEGINGQIQRMKGRACGFRNRERFRMAIYFHCGGLDLYPSSLTSGQ